MAMANVSPQMRAFMARYDDAPIRNSRFEHDAHGELLLEECEGKKALYIKTCASGTWEEIVRPFGEAE